MLGMVKAYLDGWASCSINVLGSIGSHFPPWRNKACAHDQLVRYRSDPTHATNREHSIKRTVTSPTSSRPKGNAEFAHQVGERIGNIRIDALSLIRYIDISWAGAACPNRDNRTFGPLLPRVSTFPDRVEPRNPCHTVRLGL